MDLSTYAIVLQGTVLAVGGMVGALWRSIGKKQDQMTAQLGQINGRVRTVEIQANSTAQRVEDHLEGCAQRMRKVNEDQRDQWQVINELQKTK